MKKHASFFLRTDYEWDSVGKVPFDQGSYFCSYMWAQCIDAFILPNWNCLNYRPTDTDTILEENRKNCRFYRLYMDV